MRLFEADILHGLFVYNETRLRGMVDFPSQEGEVCKNNTDKGVRFQATNFGFSASGLINVKADDFDVFEVPPTLICMLYGMPVSSSILTSLMTIFDQWPVH